MSYEQKSLGKLRGRVIHGDKVGRKLGYPTANLARHYFNRHPVNDGVYAGIATVNTRRYSAAVVIGVHDKVEVHLIGYRGNLYGTMLEVTLVKKLRVLSRYRSDDMLTLQIARDVERAKTTTLTHLGPYV
ncbi:hypothetical protein COV04_04320 [Candidatus Uhrbacteria bacterium CG10_big_fil_rev_8_21_14_0_10_48_11]|uniref:riboflavin kinase n=1 Tax=Candidatus Uhrbacteria bacterium CG10_big_fil_rev_8_21_14_0_10_48_11 TaxID=1975037 RepID=A0A2M8LDH7_9BACT|nr:MAG: hypothetical protein COV04_04320 [Candidatus Uhrbacteria bacterium CG10_big_fil_rev_8_21_14_0_10_48_11]